MVKAAWGGGSKGVTWREIGRGVKWQNGKTVEPAEGEMFKMANALGALKR